MINKDALLKELDELYSNCSEKNWDGYDADPIAEEIYNEAKRLIDRLDSLEYASYIPSHYLPMPEVSCEPGGAIIFDWYIKDIKQVIILSINEIGKIGYTSFVPPKMHKMGTADFIDVLPMEVGVFLRDEVVTEVIRLKKSRGEDTPGIP